MRALMTSKLPPFSSTNQERGYYATSTTSIDLLLLVLLYCNWLCPCLGLRRQIKHKNCGVPSLLLSSSLSCPFNATLLAAITPLAAVSCAATICVAGFVWTLLLSIRHCCCHCFRSRCMLSSSNAASLPSLLLELPSSTVIARLLLPIAWSDGASLLHPAF